MTSLTPISNVPNESPNRLSSDIAIDEYEESATSKYPLLAQSDIGL